MASVLSESKWNCSRCTFQQSALNDQCEICGEQNKSITKLARDDNHNNKNNNNKSHAVSYGCIIYQIDRFSDNQLTATHTLYLQNPDINTSAWPVYLFGDNDIDNSRPPNTDREMIGGLAGVAGKYDRNIAFGVITTFYAYKPMPDFPKFKEIINSQFEILWHKYISNGHNLIIPSPNKNDLKHHFKSFYQQINSDDDNPQFAQVIFHNIGTGIARLPLSYLQYIQYKIDNISTLSHQYNESVSNHKNEMKTDQKMEIDEFKEEKAIIIDKTDKKEIDFCGNDIVEVCVNPSVDIWVDAIFLGYSDNKHKCLIEIIKKNAENHFMIGVDIKYVRFASNEWQNKAAAVEEEKKMELDCDTKENSHKLVTSDEWENVSDFVLKEYIRDVSDELSSDLFGSLDEFMRRMEFLGVYSAASRSRALRIIEEMKNNRESLQLAQQLQAAEKKENEAYNTKMNAENDEFLAAEIAQRLADGHTLEVFSCIRCSKAQEFGGIELRNCTHKICYKCFPALISSHIAMKMLPTCLKCGSVIHETDIKIHVNAHTADIVSDIHIKEMMSKQKDLHQCFAPNCNGCIIIEDKYMKEFRCPSCQKRNCIKCKKIHNGNEQCYVPPPPKLVNINAVRPAMYHNVKNVDNGNYHIGNEEFINNWVNITDIKSSSMIRSYDVALNSEEWNKIILHIRDPSKRKIERIERIQNAKVWRAYYAYCNKMKKSKRWTDYKVGGFWHGTRTHKPALIWKSNGFLKAKSRIGKCLWFATENTYSMGGFQHAKSNGQHQVFLAFVCCGNSQKDVKFIRQNKILNVYKDAATYPAYLLTYKNV